MMGIMMLNEFEARSYGGAGIGGLLRSGFDAGIGRETVVPMGRGKPGAKDRATG